MNALRTCGAVVLLSLVSLLAGCRCAPSAAVAGVSAVPPELAQQSYLFEVVRYLYRWQLDDAEVERAAGSKTFVFWVQRANVELDPGDQSVLGDILIPQLSMRVRVKKADYRIEELQTTVKSPAFRVVQVVRERMPAQAPRGAAVVTVETQEMRDYLFRTRSQHDYPSPALVSRLQQALREEAQREGVLTNLPAGERFVHVAPLSPVANELWVFWEAGRKLFCFASDIDLANPEVWRHETLLARIYDLDQQVVVSHEEAPGSSRFLTRYEVSRALFNCLLLGQRLAVQPPDDSVFPKLR